MSRRRKDSGLIACDPEPLQFNGFGWIEDLRDDLAELYGDMPPSPDPVAQRQRIMPMLGLLNEAFGKHPDFADIWVRYDLITLVQALDDIAHGRRNKLLEPPPIIKPTHSLRTRNRRRLVGCMAHQLMKAGMSNSKACAFVANELTTAGIGSLRPQTSGQAKFSANTVRSWANFLETDEATDIDRAEVASAKSHTASIAETKSSVKSAIADARFQSLFN